jgi:hypothetical protein
MHYYTLLYTIIHYYILLYSVTFLIVGGKLVFGNVEAHWLHNAESRKQK